MRRHQRGCRKHGSAGTRNGKRKDTHTAGVNWSVRTQVWSQGGSVRMSK